MILSCEHNQGGRAMGQCEACSNRYRTPEPTKRQRELGEAADTAERYGLTDVARRLREEARRG